jgi:hypothetical protein
MSLLFFWLVVFKKKKKFGGENAEFLFSFDSISDIVYVFA